MVELNNVTYYSLEEIAANPDNKLTKEEIIEFLNSNPTYGIKLNNEWHSYSLAVRYMNSKNERTKTVYLAGIQGLDMKEVRFKGRLLDIGAGGEGIIGQIAGEQSVGIAPAIHGRELKRAPGNGLKIMMDAADMQFLEDTFDSAAAFYTLMYIDNSSHEKVFKEIYRVLKPGAELYIWDMVIPKKHLPDKDIYLVAMEITLPSQKVDTGYGALWEDKIQNAGYFDALAEAVGFEKVESLEENKLIRLIYKKPIRQKMKIIP